MDDSDEQLVRAAQRGSAAAFDHLVRRYSKTAVTLALAHVPGADPDAAEDVAQEALIRAWKSLDSCARPDRFGAWLHTIVRRTALNVRSTADRRRQMRIRHAPDIVAGTIPARGGAPDRIVESQLGHALALALGRLLPRQRQVLLLHDLEGRPHREIGELLGITAGTSRKHLSDARARVRAELARPDRGEAACQ